MLAEILGRCEVANTPPELMMVENKPTKSGRNFTMNSIYAGR
jgi:hypothetical protein